MPGAAADLTAAMKLVPLEAVEAILFMIEAGELLEPAPGAGMDAWLEQCRQAGAGEFRLTLGHRAAPERQVESAADFLARLARERAEADAARGIAPSPSPVPVKPISLADELRTMGLM